MFINIKIETDTINNQNLVKACSKWKDEIPDPISAPPHTIEHIAPGNLFFCNTDDTTLQIYNIINSELWVIAGSGL